MTTRELLRGVMLLRAEGNLDSEVSHVTADSREVRQGSLFVACPGPKVDGHAFIPEALAKGAQAVVSEWFFETPFPHLQVQVADAKEALATIAAHFYGDPAEKLTLVGITGTNGKTTVSYLVEKIFGEAGWGVGRVGTVDYRIGSQTLPSPNTTPGPLLLHELLKQMVEKGLTHGVMEVSSHALDQKRTFGLPFKVAVFTNLTHDHLDYHPDLDSYFEAKLKLFRPLPKEAWAVVNQDDPRRAQIETSTAARLLTYGLSEKAMLYPEKLQGAADGFSFILRSPFGSTSIRSHLVGRHNVTNVLAAVGVGLSLSIPLTKISEAIQSLEEVPGRLERIPTGQSFALFVDYAHTEDGLRNVLIALRPFTKRRLIVVFGCGGDRDRTKRPKMGRIASEAADRAIVTSDNPRSEDPMSILQEIIVGFSPSFRAYEVIENRASAIERALEMAGEGDLVLIDGKGHETVQILNGKTIPFDDRQVVRELLLKKFQSVSRVA